MQTLFPAIKPYAIHHMAMDDIHTIYVEESGNPDGVPVLFLHGGPGGGTSPEHRRFFDPNGYRIILFDQRGAGLSKPHAELRRNTSQDLISDMEAIRQRLGIERWVLFGGSWGTTLALYYAETYPERVLNMVLRGIFLCRPQDLRWFYEPGGASRIFPEAFENFIGHLSPEKRSTVIKSYHELLTSEDELARMSAAKAWSEWEGICSTLLPNPNTVNHFTDPHVALGLARIETHYFMNKVFLKPNQLIKKAKKLANIPGTIVHGRYDMVCPFDNAYALQKVWPKSRLFIMPEAGHSAFEPSIICALVTATNQILETKPS